MTREELDDIHQRISDRLAAKQSLAHDTACEEDGRFFKRRTTLAQAHLMVMGAFGEAREIVREEIEKT